MTELQCKNCGAPLGEDGKCRYCGTVYQLDYNGPEVRYVEVRSSPVQTLTSKVVLSGEAFRYIQEENLAEYAQERLQHSLAEGLKDAMKVVVSHDRALDAIVVRGTVRVVPPDFRF